MFGSGCPSAAQFNMISWHASTSWLFVETHAVGGANEWRDLEKKIRLLSQYYKKVYC